jgi:surface protein
MVFKPVEKLQLQGSLNDWLNGTINANTTINKEGAGSGAFGDISTWDTSLITNMALLFRGKPEVIEGSWDQRPNWSHVANAIGSWDTSNVTTMDRMFTNSQFNHSLNLWDTSKVTDMYAMFWGTPFNKDISNWDVGNVLRMYAMFNQSSFNKNISNWDTSNVENMRLMFNLSSFNQNIGNWDTSKVTDMYGMFANSKFNHDIGRWNTKNVVNAVGMFFNSPFNQKIGNWDTSKMQYMSGMFKNSAFNQNIGKWRIGKVTHMVNIFGPTEPDISLLSAQNKCAIETSFKKQKPKLWQYNWDACFAKPQMPQMPQIFIEDKRPSEKKGRSRVTSSEVAVVRQQIKRLPKGYRERGRVSGVPQGEYLQLVKWRALSS